ncbi:MAG: hypothetical protein IKT95_00375 [Spirochaetales bacterium]|nr:hypothetical protein [Spirochaetales bacterium]
MDRKYLDDRLRELGIYSEYYHRLELKPLASVLPYDDTLNCIFTGYWDGVRRLVAITSSRIFVIVSGIVAQGQMIVIKRSAVTSWSFKRRFLLSSAEICTPDKKYVFSQTQAGREKLFNWAMEQPVKEYEE